jgi:hypothetical protein
MTKIISFSIWGDNPKYTVGAIRNAQLAQIHFVGWECHFYYDSSVPGIIISALNQFTNSKTIKVDDGTFGAFWRFRAMEKDTIVLSRDTDSRLSERERIIVSDWLNTDTKLCIIRDHLHHYEFPILAGMWGIKDGLDIPDHRNMAQYNNTHKYLVDQYYLRDIIWPKYQLNSFVYGIKETVWMRNSYLNIGKDFIGQTYDENEIPIYEGKLCQE